MVYVTTNGLPSKLWKAKALPAKTNDPALNGVSVNCFIRDAANLPLSNDAFNGSSVKVEFSAGLYSCSKTTSTG
jgi:hypothetical protein